MSYSNDRATKTYNIKKPKRQNFFRFPNLQIKKLTYIKQNLDLNKNNYYSMINVKRAYYNRFSISLKIELYDCV